MMRIIPLVIGNLIHPKLQNHNHCNYYAMENWIKFYQNVEIGTALTDTIGVDAFLKDFNRKLSMLYPSVRQDSGSVFDNCSLQ